MMVVEDTAAAPEPTETEVEPMHRRSEDGIEVRLFWTGPDLPMHIQVDDVKEDLHFEINPASGAEAMHAFYHPMLYAPRGGE